MVSVAKNFNNNTKRFIIQTQAGFYKQKTKNEILPIEKQYWTLAHIQDKSPKSEINSLINISFLKKYQFFGVDIDESKIKLNKANHPEANWICADILSAVQDCENFNPGIFYFDTISSIENPIYIGLTRKLMSCCPPETLFFANFVMKNYRNNLLYTQDFLIKNLFKTNKQRLPWEFCGSFEYKGSVIPMKTFVFFRGK